MGKFDGVLLAADFDNTLRPENMARVPERNLLAVLEANKAAKTVALVTGPEGGFAPFEADLARIVGLHICSMGERILRCETAPVVATTAVMYATGNLS